jgi:hypothetical protein
MRIRGRIYIAGAVVPFAFAAGLAPAAGAKSSKPKTSPVSCTVLVTTEVPTTSTVVLPSAAQGEQWGAIHCGKKLGSGAQRTVFKAPDTGDVTGTFASWFGTGAIRGKYMLTQSEGQLTTPSQFAFTSYTGTIKVTGGLGAFQGAKGTGTTTCTSQDGLHFKCHEKLSFTSL